MADRFVLKQFAGSATNNGAFGAAQATGAGVQPVANIKDVQSLNAFEQGWNSATLTADKLPALEEMQGLEALLCKAIKENYSEGIPLWISGETYYQDSRAVFNGKVYRNKTGSYTANNPATDTANWELDKPDTAGTADVANKLGTATVGSLTRGIYLDNGVPTPTSANLANDDLSNLTQTGESHFCNPALTNSPYTTNRILEIPQDIKLELNNGTLTLKAGSKVYVPNGFEQDGTTPKFDVITTSVDLTMEVSSGARMMFVKNESTVSSSLPVSNCFSGSSDPGHSGYRYWYDTTNNIIKFDGNTGSWDSGGYSLPVGIRTADGSVVTSIDQVFNGFGYIGLTAFVLPGVKVQIPDGRTEDGLCKEILWTSSSVFVSASVTWNGYVMWLVGAESKGFPIGPIGTSWRYNSDTNYNKTSSSPKWPAIPCCIGFVSSGKITRFIPYQVDSVANSNASNFSAAGRSYLSRIGMPSSKYEDWTLLASGQTYTAPANGYLQLAATKALSLQIYNTTAGNYLKSVFDYSNSENYIAVTCEARKGDILRVHYNITTTRWFRFYYAEGEN